MKQILATINRFKAVYEPLLFLVCLFNAVFILTNNYRNYIAFNAILYIILASIILITRVVELLIIVFIVYRTKKATQTINEITQ